MKLIFAALLLLTIDSYSQASTVLTCTDLGYSKTVLVIKIDMPASGPSSPYATETDFDIGCTIE